MRSRIFAIESKSDASVSDASRSIAFAVSLALYSILGASFFLGNLIFPSQASCDSLEKLLNSPELRNLETEVENRGAQTEPQWLPPGDNFSKIFLRGEIGIPIAFEWLGEPAASQYIGQPVMARVNKEYVSGERRFNVQAGRSIITATILVPHPKHAGLVDMNLIPAFAEFEPPLLKFKAEEQVVVGGLDATLFNKVDGSCSLVFRLPKKSLLEFKAPSCEASRSIITLAESLNLTRLKQKLES